MGERSGHPEIAWTILLDATVGLRLSPDEVRARLSSAWPRALGPPPDVTEVPEADLVALAATPFEAGASASRVVVAPGDRTRVVVVADHGVLDGLGLVGVLAAAMGMDLGTTARGLGSEVPARRGGAGYAIRRLADALVRPPARIGPGPDVGPRGGDGEHLVAELVPGRVDTAALVAAATRAVRRWNAETADGGDRVVVAVGASSRPGSEPGIARSAAWFRLPVPEPTAEAVAARLRAAGPEPEPSASMMRAASRTGLSRALADRTGSTLLVSNLGGLVGAGAGDVLSAAFYPAAHGRSGVAVGAVGQGGGTWITVRARARTYSHDVAWALLERVVEEAGREAP
jgi:hypothetical protein